MHLTASRRQTSCFRAILLGGLALLVAVTVSSLASTARAGCGDYVVIGNPLHESSQAPRHQSALELPRVKPGEHSLPGTCHGPGCQQNTAYPPAPIPHPITLSSELAAIQLAGGRPGYDSCRWCVEVPAARRVEGVSDRLERPPREGVPSSLDLRRQTL